MPLENYSIFIKPNKWNEPKYARPFYDIYNKATGKKYRIAASELWNTPEKLIEIFGEDTTPLVETIKAKERDIEGLKEKYLDLYNAVKTRYDAGMKIPKQWIIELEDIFDQMYTKDVSFGNFSQDDDTLEGIEEQRKILNSPISNHNLRSGQEKLPPVPHITGMFPGNRTPEREAPHVLGMPRIKERTVDEDDYQGMNMQMSVSKIARKARILSEIEKDDVSGTGTTGPTPVRSIGYVGESANTGTPGYRNPVYDKKKKKKVKQFMKARGFVGNIEDLTNRNKAFRHVLYTAGNSQLVLMNLKPGEEIGMEMHKDVDQFFRVDSGVGMVIIDEHRYKIKDGTGIVVPAGAKHNVINISKEQPLKLYTIYSPPEHKDQVIRETKEEAETKKEEFDGKTTE